LLQAFQTFLELCVLLLYLASLDLSLTALAYKLLNALLNLGAVIWLLLFIGNVSGLFARFQYGVINNFNFEVINITFGFLISASISVKI
jgi:hypothetical protein